MEGVFSRTEVVEIKDQDDLSEKYELNKISEGVDFPGPIATYLVPQKISLTNLIDNIMTPPSIIKIFSIIGTVIVFYLLVFE